METLRLLAYINLAFAAILGILGVLALTQDWGGVSHLLAFGGALIFLILGIVRLRSLALQQMQKEARGR